MKEVLVALLSNIAGLIDVKSIVTFLVMGTLCALVIQQGIEIPSELFAAVVSSIITYFFTKNTNTVKVDTTNRVEAAKKE